MFVLFIDSDVAITNYPNIILLGIDNIKYYIFPKIYKLSDKKLAYVYNDTLIKNTVIDDNISLFIVNVNQNIEIKQLSYRSL